MHLKSFLQWESGEVPCILSVARQCFRRYDNRKQGATRNLLVMLSMKTVSSTLVLKVNGNSKFIIQVLAIKFMQLHRSTINAFIQYQNFRPLRRYAAFILAALLPYNKLEIKTRFVGHFQALWAALGSLRSPHKLLLISVFLRELAMKNSPNLDIMMKQK